MAVSKTLILLFAAVAVAVAEEAPKDKRDILIGAVPYAAAGYPYNAAYAAPGYVAAPAVASYAAQPVAYAARPAAYAAVPAAYAAAPAAYAAVPAAYPAYDDGKYYPGKYEKPTVYTAPRVIF